LTGYGCAVKPLRQLGRKAQKSAEICTANPIVAVADITLWRATPVERQTVSIMKACEMVGVSRRTIYNWIAANKVEYLRTAGGSIRIFVDTLWREPDGTKHPTNHTAA
jgi:excisionase family DNA binding protein